MTRLSWPAHPGISIVTARVRVSLVLLAVAAAACVPQRYEERPLDPERSAGEWSELRLDAPALAEFARAKVDLIPLSGEALQKLVEDLGNMPPDLLAKVKANYGG